MKNWYIIQSHSSFENKAAQLIKDEAEKAKILDKIKPSPTIAITSLCKKMIAEGVDVIGLGGY